MSKLEQFILFHLFKAPALLLAAALACEGARRVLRRRAGGVAASPFDPVDFLPEADL